MDAKYCFAFLVLAAIAALAAVVGWDILGPPSLIFGYVSVSFLLLAVAYGGAGPGLFLKRETGQRPVWAWLYFAPYFAMNAVTFRLYRLLNREPAFAQAAPQLYFGRRLSSREARKARELGWVGVLDLAGEFAEVEPLRTLPNYRSLPVLDATAPTEDELRAAIAWLIETVRTGPVYVHCALGHGRTACVVVAYLLATGFGRNIGEMVQHLRSSRPGVDLHPVQKRLLQKFEPVSQAETTALDG